MALVVRNTFLDYSQQEDDKSPGRSNSAPPSTRYSNRDKGEVDFAAVSTSDFSTTCGASRTSRTVSTTDFSEPDTPRVSDTDDVVSLSSYNVTEHEGDSPSMSRQELQSGHDACLQPFSANNHHLASQALDTQQQLEQMSQMVMDIWSKLRSMESSIEAQNGDAATTEAVADIKTEIKTQLAQMPAPQETKNVGQAAACQQKLAVNARLFVPSGEYNEAHDVLSLVGQALKSAHGVADVDVALGPAGTLATITVKVHPNAFKSSVIIAAKSAFLEVASTSESTYVLGYEAAPFQDDVGGSGFCAALASMPPAWECSACWDTYTMGYCPRRKNCRWQHPGRNQLQPVKVVVKA